MFHCVFEHFFTIEQLEQLSRFLDDKAESGVIEIGVGESWRLGRGSLVVDRKKMRPRAYNRNQGNAVLIGREARDFLLFDGRDSVRSLDGNVGERLALKQHPHREAVVGFGGDEDGVDRKGASDDIEGFDGFGDQDIEVRVIRCVDRGLCV